MFAPLKTILSMDSLLLFGVLLVQGLIGFINPVYFITLGYGNSICSYGITMVVLTSIYASSSSWNLHLIQILIQGVMYILYGLRMTTFISLRNRNQSYRESRDGKMQIPIRFPKTILLWISVELLYYCFCISALVGLTSVKNGWAFNSLAHWIGMGIMAVGLFFEAVGDYQKSQSKKTNPHLFCNSGLYRIVRMPNYFGEMTFWIGSYVCGVCDSKNWLQLLLGSIGVLFSVMMMIGAAMRLEKNQDESYRDNLEYALYRDSTPILFPFIPIYRLSRSGKTD